MTRLVTAFAVAALVLTTAGPQQLVGQQQQDTAASREQAAQQAAEAWLELFAAGEYEETWNEAGTLFQQQVTAEAWTQQGAGVAAQLGALQSRELEDAQYSTELPNVPPGEYVVLTWTSAFANLPNAREIVTMVLEEGQWKVIGYFVQPAQGA